MRFAISVGCNDGLPFVSSTKVVASYNTVNENLWICAILRYFGAET